MCVCVCGGGGGRKGFKFDVDSQDRVESEMCEKPGGHTGWSAWSFPGLSFVIVSVIVLLLTVLQNMAVNERERNRRTFFLKVYVTGSDTLWCG